MRSWSRAALRLGRLRRNRGSSLRIKLLVSEGVGPPPIDFKATALDGPAYQRVARARNETDIVLPGLGAGRFRLEVLGGFSLSEAGGRGALGPRIVTVDGESDLEVEYDLR